jgi:hypothetical protein
MDPRRNPFLFIRAVRRSHVADVRMALEAHPEWAVQAISEFVPSSLPSSLMNQIHPFGVLDYAVNALENDCSPAAHAVLRLLLAYGADPITRFEEIQDESEGFAASELYFDPYNINPFQPQRWPRDTSWDRVLRAVLRLMSGRSGGRSNFEPPTLTVPAPSSGAAGVASLTSLGYEALLDANRRVVERGLSPDHIRWADIMCDLAEAAMLGSTARREGLDTWADLCRQAPLMVAQSMFYPGILEALNALWDRRRLAVASGLYATDSWEVLSASLPPGGPLADPAQGEMGTIASEPLIRSSPRRRM